MTRITELLNDINSLESDIELNSVTFQKMCLSLEERNELDAFEDCVTICVDTGNIDILKSVLQEAGYDDFIEEVLD